MVATPARGDLLRLEHVSVSDSGSLERFWPQMVPLVKAACRSNAVSLRDNRLSDIHTALKCGDLAAFAVVDPADRVRLVFGYRFVACGGRKGVELVFMAGCGLRRCVSLFWPSLTRYFRYNGASFVECYADARLARVYRRLIGVDRQCIYMQGDL